ncbi:MAG: hypothetical protein ACP5UA_10575 [Candidatus Hydrogenedens sp.]
MRFNKNYILPLIICLFIIIIFTACRPKETKKTEEIPQTKEDFLKQLNEILSPIQMYIPFSPNVNYPYIREDIRLQVINDVFNFVQKYADNPLAQEACKEVAKEVAQWAKIAKDNNRWVLALACIDIYETLGAKSEALRRLKMRGEQLVAQPKVFIRGFLEDKDTGQTTIFVEVINRITGEKKRVAARVGDEFDNIRVVEIIPYKNVVRFEYIPIEGMFFDVEGPKF